MAPPKLAPRLRSLPPILYMKEPHPMTGYSKAPRGLSVQLRVVRVFTDTTTSPSPWSRQRSSRYAIRAGRNLPDKEFRYLRTVIVTAAVHRGFGSGLRLAANPSPLPSGTGQASAPIHRLAALQRHVFLLNSRLSLFTATSSGSPCTGSPYRGTPSSEGTGLDCRVP